MPNCLANYNKEGVVLGKGAFGEVVLASHFAIKKQVAMKLIDLTDLESDNYALVNLEREGRILANLNHDNIIRLIEVCRTHECFSIILEYVPFSTTMYKVIHLNGALTQENARPLVLQMFSAVAFMHSKSIIHRDIKLENILVNNNLTHCNIIDFGLSNFWEQGRRMKTLCGSLEYLAPEIIRKKKIYGPKVDVWSLGVVVYAMLMGTLPFDLDDETCDGDSEKLWNFKTRVLQGLTGKQLEAMKDRLDSACCTFIEKCLAVHSIDRISANEAGNFDWIGAPLNLREIKYSDKVLLRAAKELQVRLKVNHTPEDILKHVKDRPYRTTGGCLNLILLEMEEEEEKKKAK